MRSHSGHRGMSHQKKSKMTAIKPMILAYGIKSSIHHMNRVHLVGFCRFGL